MSLVPLLNGASLRPNSAQCNPHLTNFQQSALLKNRANKITEPKYPYQSILLSDSQKELMSQVQTKGLDLPEQFRIEPNQSTLGAIEEARLLISNHKNSKRRNPLFYLLKYLASGIVKHLTYKVRRKKIATEITKYGLRQRNGNVYSVRQVSRWTNALEQAGLINKDEKDRYLIVYRLTELGELVYWLHCEKNQSHVRINVDVAGPVEDNFEKMSLFDEKNVPLYIHNSYKQNINTHLETIQEHDLYREQKRAQLEAKSERAIRSKNGFLVSEREGKKKTLEPELNHRLKKFSPAQQDELSLCLNRLRAPVWQKNNLLEDLAASVTTMAGKRIQVANISGLLIAKYKKTFGGMRH